MPEIRILPPEVTSRIAAGEVVERPASIIKELVENAIDAHATEIEIELEDGGITSLSVKDDGCGMSAKDLPLAFASHATSKLRVEDLEGGLFGVATLGFRGEALPSIAAVADVEALSRDPRDEHAWSYRPAKGSAEPAPGPRGTTVTVRNLFHNVPARRKFLRGSSTELSHVLQQVTRLALGFPGIGFRVTQKGKKLLEYAPASSLIERLEQQGGEELARDLLEVREGEEGRGIVLRGYVGRPSLRRSDARGQHIFVNGRWVRDRLVTHALRSAYQGFLTPGWQPVAYLFIDLPSDAVDVNVHPTKCEVRFRDSSSVYPAVLRGVKRALEEGGGAGSAADRDAGEREPRRPGDGFAPHRPPLAGPEIRRHRIIQATRDFFSTEAALGGPPSETRAGSAELPPGRGPLPRPSAGPSPLVAQDREPAGAESVTAGAEPLFPGAGPARTGAASRRAFQVLDSYIVVESDGGLDFIDQHALHEKVLYEQISARLREGHVIKQRLIIPEVIELPVEQVPLVDKAREILEPCGFEIEAFGEHDLAVHAVPELLDSGSHKGRSAELIREVFERLAADDQRPEADAEPSGGEALSRSQHEIASLIACRRAVKAGMRLRPEEITSLLERAELADDPRHCPHGRPTTVRLSARELERRFDRR